MIDIVKDLYELILNQNNGDIEETILDCNQIISMVDNNSQRFVFDLNNIISEEAKENNRCEICGRELVQDTYLGDAGEYMGEEVKESFTSSHCINPDCDNY